VLVAVKKEMFGAGSERLPVVLSVVSLGGGCYCLTTPVDKKDWLEQGIAQQVSAVGLADVRW